MHGVEPVLCEERGIECVREIEMRLCTELSLTTIRQGSELPGHGQNQLFEPYASVESMQSVR